MARIKELTGGLVAHSVVEVVDSQEPRMQAIRSTRPGGHVGSGGVASDAQLPGDELFLSRMHLHGGPAPVRQHLPELTWCNRSGEIDPSDVFDLNLSPLHCPPSAAGPWTSAAPAVFCSPTDPPHTRPRAGFRP